MGMDDGRFPYGTVIRSRASLEELRLRSVRLGAYKGGSGMDPHDVQRKILVEHNVVSRLSQGTGKRNAGAVVAPAADLGGDEDWDVSVTSDDPYKNWRK